MDKGTSLFEVIGWILAITSIALALIACGGLVARNTYRGLDEDQIKAITDSRAQLVQCFGLGGPPIGGRSVAIIYPRNAKGRISFSPGSDCSIKEADIDLNGEEEPVILQSPLPFKPNPNEFNPKPRAVQPPIKPGRYIPASDNPDPCDFTGATGERWVFCK
jgi:hypothetical protein